MSELLVEIDGTHVPIAECDWVMWTACGCVAGMAVCDAGGRARPLVTEEDAWKVFYSRKPDRLKAQQSGRRMELVTHARCHAEIVPRFGRKCPHKQGGTA